MRASRPRLRRSIDAAAPFAESKVDARRLGFPAPPVRRASDAVRRRCAARRTSARALRGHPHQAADEESATRTPIAASPPYIASLGNLEGVVLGGARCLERGSRVASDDGEALGAHRGLAVLGRDHDRCLVSGDPSGICAVTRICRASDSASSREGLGERLRVCGDDLAGSGCGHRPERRRVGFGLVQGHRVDLDLRRPRSRPRRQPAGSCWCCVRPTGRGCFAALRCRPESRRR